VVRAGGGGGGRMAGRETDCSHPSAAENRLVRVCQGISYITVFGCVRKVVKSEC
jgi:hypothetical protein